MHTTYFDEDDILVIRLSNKPITREALQDWNTHISYAEDGTAVEVVLLEARANVRIPRPFGHPVHAHSATQSTVIRPPIP